MGNYIGENISFILKKKHLTQDAFAKLFDLSNGVVNQYIKKTSTPKLDTLIRIAEYYSLTLDDLILRPLTDETFNRKPPSMQLEERHSEYQSLPTKYISLLESRINDKDEIINSLKRELELLRQIT